MAGALALLAFTGHRARFGSTDFLASSGWQNENTMIENRVLTMDDYGAMLRRRLKLILIPTILAPAIGFLISYAVPPKYTSRSLVLVENQKVPQGYVAPVVTEDLSERIATLQQKSL